MLEQHRELFSPFSIGKCEIKNRYFMAAMGTTTHQDTCHAYMQDSIEHYVRRAAGGVGLIITGANLVDNTLEVHNPGGMPCPTVAPGEYIKAARELCDRVHAFDTKIFVQLTAGWGRSAVPNMLVDRNFIAPSEVSNRWNAKYMCRALTTEEVEKIIKQFAVAASICKKAGFDGVEVHAIHEGYLMDQFALSLFNKRTDRFGGDLRGRLTMATEIIKGIKKFCGEDYPVIMRFSLKSFIKDIRQGAVPGEEFEELGRDYEEGLEVAKILVEAGYDGLDVDAGTYDSWYWAHPPMYFDKGVYLPFADMIRKVVDVPLLVAGRMDDPDLAADAIKRGTCDMIGLARPLLTEPEYVNKVRLSRFSEIRPCLCCHEGCFGRKLNGALASCAVNPECSREDRVSVVPAPVSKRVAVVGGGPAGLEAARVSALRGHKVVLFEAEDHLGGMLWYGGMPSFKKADIDLINWYETQLKLLGVEVRLNTRADKAALDAFNPHTVFIATGSNPTKLSAPGADKPIVSDALSVLSGQRDAGNKVVVIGGGLVGCELALELALKGKDVTVVARRVILRSNHLPEMNEFMLRDLLAFNKVRILEKTTVKSVEDNGVLLDKEGEEIFAEADTVVEAIGFKSEKSLYEQIRLDYENVLLLGDSRKVANIHAAIWDGYEAARYM